MLFIEDRVTVRLDPRSICLLIYLFIGELHSWLVSIVFRFGDQGGFSVMGVFDVRVHSMNFAPFAHPKWKPSYAAAQIFR
jgi:hypothetical protein